MDGFDSATWQALGLVLTLLGLGVSAVLWARRGPARGLRGIAWSLLPLAAGLTGVLKLGWEVTDAVVTWASRLVFSPVVWLGLAVTALAGVLFVVSGWMLRRGGGAEARGAGDGGTAVTGGRAGELPRTASAPAAQPRARGGAASSDPELDEIEQLLRKHGIT
jgi:hypothetical protein